MKTFDIDSFLYAVAQISAALVGFSALVATLGKPENKTAHKFNLIRMRALVRIPLNGLIFALLPFPLRAVGIEEILAWRIASGLFVVVGIASTVYIYALSKQIPEEPSSYERLHMSFGILLSLIACVLMALATFGFLSNFVVPIC